MNLNKNLKMGVSVLAIIFAIFCIISFVVPFPRRGIFWTGFIFGIIAILSQLVIWTIAFRDAKSAMSKFYGMPVARIGVIYLVAQLVISFISMCLAWVRVVPVWPLILISLIMLGMTAIGIISSDVARDEIVRQDAQLKKEVSVMSELCSLSKGLVFKCDDEVVKKELKKFSEALRYSDPVSNEATSELELEIKNIIAEIQHTIADNDTEKALALCKTAESVLDERNLVCKTNKNINT